MIGGRQSGENRGGTQEVGRIDTGETGLLPRGGSYMHIIHKYQDCFVAVLIINLEEDWLVQETRTT